MSTREARDMAEKHRAEINQAMAQATIGTKPRNEIDWLQEQNEKLRAELQEQKQELLELYRKLNRY